MSSREPDAEVTKGDHKGVYSKCVLVSHGDGLVVEQNIYPGTTHCHPVFLQEWGRLLSKQWKQVGELLKDNYIPNNSRRCSSVAVEKTCVIFLNLGQEMI